MTKRFIFALDIARYGLYLVMFFSVAVGRNALPSNRLFLLAVLLLALTIFGYLSTERVRKESVRIGLLAAELIVLAAIGFTLRTGWYPVLYFVFVAEAIFALPRPRALLVIIAAYGVLGVTLYLVMKPVRLDDFVSTMLVSLSGFVFSGATSFLALDQHEARKRSEQLLQELKVAHEQLQAYAGEVERLTTTRERQRIGQEVHDTVAHVLTGLLVQLQAVRRLLVSNPTTVAVRLASMEEAARHGLGEVRRAVRAMRPQVLESNGGPQGLRKLCDQFSERTEIRVFFTTEGDLSRISPAHEAIVYHTLQECLTNAARHGRASVVWAHLRIGESGVELRVRDDGAGAAKVAPGMGISGMHDRAQAAGGRFSYRTRAGHGFETTLELPLETPASVTP